MTRHLPLLALLLVAIVVGIGVLARPAPPDGFLAFRVEGDRAYASGFTDNRASGALDRLLRQYPDVETLVLTRMPGTRDVVANTRLARRVRALGLDTHLDMDSRIASGAVDIFIGGVERTAECGARIGVHAWGVADFDAQDVGFDAIRGFQRDFLEDMGLDPDFYDFTRNAARSADIYWMDADEAWRRGLLTRDPACTP